MSSPILSISSKIVCTQDRSPIDEVYDKQAGSHLVPSLLMLCRNFEYSVNSIKKSLTSCFRRCDFVVFRQPGNVEKWWVNLYRL